MPARRSLSFSALAALFLAPLALRAALPADVAAIVKDFRTEPARGWSFTQTTSAAGESVVERCDAAKIEFERWSLVQKDGHPPTADEDAHYHEMLTRRSRGGTAPRITEQLDLTSAETVSDTPERTIYRFKLKPGEAGDQTAAYLRATLVLHKATHTVESLTLANTEEFSPTFGVRIKEMNTTMTYSLPADGKPSLPQKVTTRLRGRAFLVKSLDADMTVAFTDYAWAGKK